MTAFYRRNVVRRLFVFIAIAALGLRSLIPVGYMPDFSGHGKGLLPIVICDGFEHQNDCHHHGKQGHGGLCPFGASAIASFSLAGVGILQPFSYTEPFDASFFSQPDGKQASFNNASPRSPPLFS